MIPSRYRGIFQVTRKDREEEIKMAVCDKISKDIEEMVNFDLTKPVPVNEILILIDKYKWTEGDS